MRRVAEAFALAGAGGRKTLMPFVVAGRPSLGAMPALLVALERAGAGAIEIGFPFSDPVADGPVIAAAMHEALRAGVTPAMVFEAVSRARASVSVPLIAMVSVSVVERLGAGRFARDAAAAGLDGVIFPDAPLEEAARYTGPARESGLSAALLVAPTTPIERAARIAGASDGFLYVLARAGITGAGAPGVVASLGARLRALRRVTTLPLAVGFGVSSADDVRDVVKGAGADGAIVGSALVQRIEGAIGGGTETSSGGPGVDNRAIEAAHSFVCSLRQGLFPR